MAYKAYNAWNNMVSRKQRSLNEQRRHLEAWNKRLEEARKEEAEGFVDMAKRILCFDEKAVSIYLKVNEKYVTSTGYPATIEMRCTPYEKIKNPVKECEKEEKVKD